MCSRLATLAVLLLALSPLQAGNLPAWEAAKALLQERCTKCHGGVKHKGGLDLRAIPNILRGGESGPAVVPGDPEASLLIEVLHPDGEPSMPPKGEPLAAREVDVIRDWIVSMTSEDPAPDGEVASLPSGMPPRTVIDFLVARRWAEAGVEAAPPIDDAAFARRASLHLLGRIPTESELASFLRSTASGKREALVDSLLQHPEFARHFAELFDTILLGRRHGLTGRERPLDRSDDWHRYLSWVFRSNRPWNEVARDLLGERPSDGPALGARWYLAAHKDDHEAIAQAMAPALLGKQIACAQCHNHPLVPEIEQRHYWGLVAFFNRSFNVKTSHGLDVGESAVGGELKFSTLEGESHEAALAFFDGRTVEEPPQDKPHDASRYRVPPPETYFAELQDKKKDNKKRKAPAMESVPVPDFSRRSALVDLAVESYPDFSRALVNRVWTLLLGRGLVHPVDHLDSIHPPSHPKLLSWLGQDFAAHGYDVQGLIREIMASRVYQTSSRPLGEQVRRPAPELFALSRLQPLTAESLYRSMLVAGGHAPDSEGAFPGIDEEAYREAFARIYPDLFPETYSPQAAEGLFFSNNPLMKEILVRDFSGLSPEAGIAEAFLAAFGREPDEAECAMGHAFLGEHPDNSRFHALLWSLITSSEFRFNH